jgi:hypothetical protein
MTIDEGRIDQTPSDGGAPANESSESSVDKRTPDGRRRSDSRGSHHDERRRRRGTQDRQGASGYGDGVERATCIFIRHTLPPEFPVQHRAGLATSRPIEVDRRPDAVLLCDRNHEGACLWPDGEPVSENTGPAEVLRTAADADATQGDTNEEEAGGEPDDGGDDKNWDGSGVADQGRGDEG